MRLTAEMRGSGVRPSIRVFDGLLHYSVIEHLRLGLSGDGKLNT